MYNLELDRVVSEITARKASRVLLQLPDGMRPFAYQLEAAINQSTGATVMLSGDSCYGSCDIASRQAEELGADLVIHYGHSVMVDSSVPVVYVHAEVDIDVDALVEAAAPLLVEFMRVGLVTTVQHVHQVQEMVEKLSLRGVTAVPSRVSARTPNLGQVLGCAYGGAIALKDDVDGFLYVGGGVFHPDGLILSTGKPVVTANPYNGEVTLRSESDLMQLARRRYAQIVASMKAKKVGVIVSSKPGQRNLEKSEALIQKFRDKGVQAVLMYMDEVRPEHLNNYVEPEAFVVTACPRIAVHGVAGVDRPLLSVGEALVVLGELEWEELWGEQYFQH